MRSRGSRYLFELVKHHHPVYARPRNHAPAICRFDPGPAGPPGPSQYPCGFRRSRLLRHHPRCPDPHAPHDPRACDPERRCHQRSRAGHPARSKALRAQGSAPSTTAFVWCEVVVFSQWRRRGRHRQAARGFAGSHRAAQSCRPPSPHKGALRQWPGKRHHCFAVRAGRGFQPAGKAAYRHARSPLVSARWRLVLDRA